MGGGPKTIGNHVLIVTTYRLRTSVLGGHSIFLWWKCLSANKPKIVPPQSPKIFFTNATQVRTSRGVHGIVFWYHRLPCKGTKEAGPHRNIESSNGSWWPTFPTPPPSPLPNPASPCPGLHLTCLLLNWPSEGMRKI